MADIELPPGLKHKLDLEIESIDLAASLAKVAVAINTWEKLQPDPELDEVDEVLFLFEKRIKIQKLNKISEAFRQSKDDIDGRLARLQGQPQVQEASTARVQVI